jgi:hypothetical protein
LNVWSTIRWSKVVGRAGYELSLKNQRYILGERADANLN